MKIIHNGHLYESIESSNTLAVAFHDKCPDGFGAASAFLNSNKNVQYFPAQYGKPNEEFFNFITTNKCEVAVVDFSFPLDQMNTISENAISFLWIDHHDTAQKTLQPFINNPPNNTKVIFDMSHCGAYLTWEYLHHEVPEIIRYIEDRDLWSWKLPNSKEVNNAIWFEMDGFQGQPKDVMGKLLNLPPVNELANTGKLLTRNNLGIAQRASNGKFNLTIGDRQFVSIFANENVSETANHIVEETNSPVCVVTPNAKQHRWNLSFRSKNGLPVVNDIAQTLNGGGHPNAAGGYVEWNQLIPIEGGFKIVK